MSRTTIKEAKALMDELKTEYNFKSRNAALKSLYSDFAPRFKKHGYDLSHYKDGIFTVSNYEKFGFKWFRLSVFDLDRPLESIKIIERNNAAI